MPKFPWFQGVTHLPCETCRPRFSLTNLLTEDIEKCCTSTSPCCEMQHTEFYCQSLMHRDTTLPTVATPHSNPLHQTVSCMAHAAFFHAASGVNKLCQQRKCVADTRHCSNIRNKGPELIIRCPCGSEETGHIETIPTLRLGQSDGTTPWREFLRTFHNCAAVNLWSEKTMGIQLKFCLVGAVGTIINRNPPSLFAWWRRWRLHIGLSGCE